MRRGFLIYYRPRRERIEEFLYLIDYMLHYQILDEDTEVQIQDHRPGAKFPFAFRQGH